MKKILLFIATIIITNNSFADTEREGFYLRGGVGVDKVNSLSDTVEKSDVPLDSYIDGKTLKLKSKFSPIYNIGFGYYIDDTFRTDLTVDYSDIKFNKAKARIKFASEGNDVLLHNTATVRSNIYSVMLSGYADLNVTDDINIFFGAGIGASQIKEKPTLTTLIGIDGEYHSTETNSTTTKPKTNFAYSLTVGASHKITDNAHLELAYSWKDYGKTHPKLDDDGERTHDANRYRGHHVGVGLRFDI